MIKLVADIGNSLVKVAVFHDDEFTELFSARKSIETLLPAVLEKYGTPFSVIVSSVRDTGETTVESLNDFGVNRVVTIRSGLVLPLKIAYKTPETLGSDRLANACAAVQQFPGSDVLIADTGTCLKFDLVTADGTYQGGAISPGMKMRYQALTRFTGRLPYFKPIPAFPKFIGQSTEGSIRSGVEFGMLAEMEGIIARYREEFSELKVLLTGGDRDRFADKLKSPIFVAPELTLKGLKVILDHNDH